MKKNWKRALLESKQTTDLSSTDMCRLSGGAAVPGRRRLDPTMTMARRPSAAAAVGGAELGAASCGITCQGAALPLALALALCEAGRMEELAARNSTSASTVG